MKITRFKTEAGLNADVMTNADRNALVNLLSQDVQTGVLFRTPHDNIGYYVVSSTDTLTIIQNESKTKTVKVKHNDCNADSKINLSVRKNF